MAYHHDLLRQARLLVRHDPKRPRQANLRRAVSASYYAAFHLLTSDAAARLVSGRDRQSVRQRLRRCFDHGGMSAACLEITKQNAGKVQPWLGPAWPPAQLLSVAAAFRELQEARNRADYDMAAPFSRAEADDLVDLAEQLFSDWVAVRRSVAADALILAMLTWRVSIK